MVFTKELSNFYHRELVILFPILTGKILDRIVFLEETYYDFKFPQFTVMQKCLQEPEVGVSLRSVVDTFPYIFYSLIPRVRL